MRLRVCLVVCLFQPALPMRGVTPRFQAIGDTRQFQPVLPMRGVTRGWNGRDGSGIVSRKVDFNPHSPCGE